MMLVDRLATTGFFSATANAQMPSGLDDLRRVDGCGHVPPDDLYESVMNGKKNLAKGSVF